MAGFLEDLGDTVNAAIRTSINARAAERVARVATPGPASIEPTTAQPSGRPDPNTPNDRWKVVGVLAVIGIIGVVVWLARR